MTRLVCGLLVLCAAVCGQTRTILTGTPLRICRSSVPDPLAPVLSADAQVASYALCAKAASATAAAAGTDYVLGGSNLTTIGAMPYISGAGYLAQAGTLRWNASYGTLGMIGAPPLSSSQALLMLGAAPAGSSPSGTYLNVNAAPSFGGTLFRLQKNGANRFTVSEGGVAYFTPYQDNVSVLHITTASGNYRVVMGTYSSRSGYLDLYSGAGVNTVRLAGDGYPARFGVGAIVGPNAAQTHTGTLSVLDATQSTGSTIVNVGHDGNGHTSAAVTSMSIRAGAAQGSTAPLQVQASNGAAAFTVTASGDEVARSLRLNPGAASLPACTASNRGQFWLTYGGIGVADTVLVCAKDAVDAFLWRRIS